MDDNQVWAIISPRSAIHVARYRTEPAVADMPDGPSVAWVEFPCMGGPIRSAGDLAIFTDDDEEMAEAAQKLGSRGMYCMRNYCETQRRRHHEEDSVSTVNNIYEDGGWAVEAWQVMVTLCVVVFIVCVAGLIWHAVDMSRDSNVAHQRTLQVKYLACASDVNPRFCLQKVQE